MFSHHVLRRGENTVFPIHFPAATRVKAWDVSGAWSWSTSWSAQSDIFSAYTQRIYLTSSDSSVNFLPLQLGTQFPTSTGVMAGAAASLCSFQFQSIDDIISGESTCQSTSCSSCCIAPALLLHSELGVWTRFNGLRSFLKSICESTGKQIQNVWERRTIRHKTE